MTNEIKDFTPSRRSIRFKIGEDEFEAAPELPTKRALLFSKKSEQFETADSEELLDLMEDIARLVLRTESAERFLARLDDPDRPIGPKTFVAVVMWLMEEYGLRPTPPSADSSGGSGSADGGTNSTESAPELASISALSPSTAS